MFPPRQAVMEYEQLFRKLNFVLMFSRIVAFEICLAAEGQNRGADQTNNNISISGEEKPRWCFPLITSAEGFFIDGKI